MTIFDIKIYIRPVVLHLIDEIYVTGLFNATFSEFEVFNDKPFYLFPGFQVGPPENIDIRYVLFRLYDNENHCILPQ